MTPAKRFLPVALSLCLCGPAMAQQTYDAEPYPGYGAECGFRIDIERTPYLSKAQILADDVPVIVIDPQLLRPRQAFHRTFLIAHECAHHHMKHTTRAGLAKRYTQHHGIRDQEMSADCWAAETLARKGMLPGLLDLADQFWRRGFVSPGGGYPSGIQRSNVIRHCAQIAAAKMKRQWHPAER